MTLYHLFIFFYAAQTAKFKVWFLLWLWW